MKILGIHCSTINTSACILVNGQIKFAIQEERITREKFTGDFPDQSIKACLNHEGINFKDLDYVVVGWNPSMFMKRFNPVISSKNIKQFNFYLLSDNLFKFSDRQFGDFTKIEHDNSNFPKIIHLNHHLAHAGNAFYLSNFKEAAILTCDFRGEFSSTSFCYGKKNKIKTLEVQDLPHSLGMFYSTFTELLGYKADSDEWKVMAMSAYNYKCDEYVKKIKKTFKLKKNGKLELISKYFSYFLYGSSHHLYTEKLLKLLNIKKIIKTNSPTISQIKIAKALQICAEEIASHFLKHIHKITRAKNIVLSGGFFYNSVFNGKIEKKSKFKKSFISYCPADAGNAMGSALFAYFNILNKKRFKINNSPYLGTSFKNSEIEKSFKRRRIKFEKINDFSKVVAKECYDQKVVGLFRNRMEFGDRALGNRSIIADPRFAEMKKKINDSVKYREPYRPFAPSVINEKANFFFEFTKGQENNYMERVLKVKKKYRKKLEAVTHFDDSARVQTVNKNNNKDFHKILLEFEKLSGIPILLNTSFNVNGEPVVCSPDDAINTFYNSKIDTLIIGDYLVRK